MPNDSVKANDPPLRRRRPDLGPGVVELDLKCPEPGCGADLELRPSRYGFFYGCATWHRTRCPAAHGAHADGRPLGIPASKATKVWRIRAHAAFDRLWTRQPGEGGPRMPRSDAYAWMRQAMGLTRAEAHMGRFTAKQCRELIALVNVDHKLGVPARGRDGRAVPPPPEEPCPSPVA